MNRRVVKSIEWHENISEKFLVYVPGLGIANQLAEQLERHFLLPIFLQAVLLQQLIVVYLNGDVE